MTENPYQSPQSVPDGPKPLDPQWRAFMQKRRRPTVVATDRPTVVTVICVLQLVCISLQMIVLFGTSLEGIVAGIQLLGLSPALVLGIAMASWSLGMISALGMWSGAKWGWWTGAFFYAYSILRTFFALVQLELLAQHNFLPGQMLTFNALWLVIRIPILALILILFFTDDFLAYFERSPERKYLAATGVVVAALLVEAAEVGVLLLMRTKV